MIEQPEFEAIVAALPPPRESPPPKIRPGLNTHNWTIALTKALRRAELSHPVFSYLLAAARAQQLRGYATIPQIALDCGCTFQAVDQQLYKTHGYFSKDTTTRPARLTLTQDAIAIIHRVNSLARKYATNPTP